MTVYRIGLGVISLLLWLNMTSLCQSPAIPPTEFEVSIVESEGLGCHQTTNHSAGKICFDVSVKINTDNWLLYSYNVWMDYGGNNLVLSYESDASCVHQNGGAVNLDQFGKYRFLAANHGLSLPANQHVNFHNFCLDIVDFSGLDTLSVIPGGVQFSTVSSMTLVDTNDITHSINLHLGSGDPFEMTESSFLVIEPNAMHECNNANLHLSAMPLDGTGPGIIDCEPFTFLWTGPNGFQSSTIDVNIPIVDPAMQSGLYELVVTGQNGCEGYQSFLVDLSTCVCQNVLTIEGPISLLESKQARIEIVAEGNVQVGNDLIFAAPTITLKPSFEVPAGIDFETTSIGCP